MDSGGFETRLAAARRGDETAFIELFRSVQPALVRYLTALGGPGLAEDAAAETWMHVVRGLSRFEGDESGWRGWVFTIARARLRDAQRHAARQPLPVDTDELFAGLPGGVEVDAAVEELMSTEAALALIARLPRDRAEAVLLRHVAGLDVAHTARVLGKRPGAVRVATHRGLRRLAEMLGTTAPTTSGADAGTDAATGRRGVTDPWPRSMTT